MERRMGRRYSDECIYKMEGTLNRLRQTMFDLRLKNEIVFCNLDQCISILNELKENYGNGEELTNTSDSSPQQPNSLASHRYTIWGTRVGDDRKIIPLNQQYFEEQISIPKIDKQNIPLLKHPNNLNMLSVETRSSHPEPKLSTTFPKNLEINFNQRAASNSPCNRDLKERSAIQKASQPIQMEQNRSTRTSSENNKSRASSKSSSEEERCKTIYHSQSLLECNDEVIPRARSRSVRPHSLNNPHNPQYRYSAIGSRDECFTLMELPIFEDNGTAKSSPTGSQSNSREIQAGGGTLFLNESDIISECMKYMQKQS